MLMGGRGQTAVKLTKSLKSYVGPRGEGGGSQLRKQRGGEARWLMRGSSTIPLDRRLARQHMTVSDSPMTQKTVDMRARRVASKPDLMHRELGESPLNVPASQSHMLASKWLLPPLTHKSVDN